jgi:CBS domain containing-hemolysin-like protein
MGMTLRFWTQLLLILLLALARPLVDVLGFWVLLLLGVAYLWLTDVALSGLLTARDPAAWLERLVPSYDLVHQVLSPLVAPVARVVQRRHEEPDSAAENEEASEEAVTAFLEEGEAEGILEEKDRELIRNVVGFGDTVVREVMTPRTNIKALSKQTTVDAAWSAIAQWRHSRIPVFEGGIDEIVGVVLLKDLMQLPDQSQISLGELMKPPLFVPESKPTLDLLRDLQRARTKLAIVVDEFGSVTGLVTLEDLLEEVFGEIREEHDGADTVQELSPTVYLVSGHAHVEDVAERLGAAWERDGFDTVGGLVMARLGRIPRVQDSFLEDGTRLTVLRMEGAKVLQVRVEILAR